MTNVLTPPDLRPTDAPLATEQEAREIAEAAREKEWQAPSFVRQLFEGSFRLDLIHPFPTQDAADLAKAQPFFERLERFLREQVDSDRIDREGKIPPAVLQGLRELGAFGIKIPEEYGGLGLSQTLHPCDRSGDEPGRQPYRAAVSRAVDRRTATAQALRHP
jgi:Acyl-CoA dehydrogenase, N-terminal domain